MTLRKLTLLFCLLLALPVAGRASETPTEHAANVAAQQEMDAAPRHGNLPDYTLPPDKLAKAQHLDKIFTYIVFGGTLWGILQLVLWLAVGAVGWMRDRAIAAGDGLRAKGNLKLAKWVEGFTFALLFNAAVELLTLPLLIFRHHLSLSYGISIQGWGSWLIDLAKSFAIGWAVTGLLFMLLYWVVQTFPRRWWLVAWGCSAPIILFSIYLTPLLIDPIFNHFEPLQKTQPALVAKLGEVVARGHMDIPPERMFLMDASVKTTALNAYVTGFGGSKRLVLWDTSLKKFSTDELLLVFGHESGHYVLGHVTEGMALIFVGLFVALYLGFRFVNWGLARFGTSWRIPSQTDWGMMVVLLLAFSILSAISDPVSNTISRAIEHDADVYGQEAVHGIVADPEAVAKKSFDVLGEAVFEDPNPSPFIEFWQYNHPATGRRAAFAAHYDPWADGAEPKYFKK